MSLPHHAPTAPFLPQLITLPDLDTFKFGELEDVDHTAIEEEVERTKALSVTEDGLSDVWDLSIEQDAVSGVPPLRTWEAFLDSDYKEPPSAYLSEAGPAVFDAAIDDYEGAPSQSDTPRAILQSAFVLKCLAMLGQGRPSVLFQWEQQHNTFKSTIACRVSGTSSACFHDLMQGLTRCGNSVVWLQNFIRQTYASRSPSAARVALASGVEDVLSAIESLTLVSLPAVTSFIQLEALFARPARLMAEVLLLTECCGALVAEDKIVSAVHRTVDTSSDSSSPFHHVFKTLSVRVSHPMLQSLCSHVGLTGQISTNVDSPGLDSPFFATTFGPFSGPAMSTQSSDRGSEVLTLEEVQFIGDLRNGIQVVERSTPDHPLIVPSAWQIRQPKLDTVVSLHDAERVLSLAEQYEADLTAALHRYSCTRSRDINTEALIPVLDASVDTEQSSWRNDEVQQQYFAEIGVLFSDAPRASDKASNRGFRDIVTSTLQHDSPDVPTTFIADRGGLLQDLWPLLRVQSRLVHSSVMRLLFRQHDLRKHLTVQRDFHMFRSGVFLHRLMTALFSSTEASAEQKRGTIPTGYATGLRLNARSSQHWPPASSELRLTLAGILSDTYGTSSQNDGAQGAELPGGLSFAIRELSDADIDRVVDPHSVFALDFLRLQYSPPAPVDQIITASSLHKYDDIFRFLLQVVRVMHVTTEMHASHCTRASRSSKPSPALAHFAFQAHILVSILAAYIFDVGIDVPWASLNNDLDTLEAALVAEDRATDACSYGTRTQLSLEGLRTRHDGALESVRTRLLLRTRHGEAKTKLVRIFTIILQVSASRNGDSGMVCDVRNLGEELLERFRELIHLLGEAAAKGKTKTGDARDDVAAFELLRRQLELSISSFRGLH